MLLQHLGLLLSSPHPEVVEEALKTLVSFVKKTHHATIRWHGNRDINARLMTLCQGWGVSEEVRTCMELKHSPHGRLLYLDFSRAWTSSRVSKMVPSR
jgi:hypothetical protein